LSEAQILIVEDSLGVARALDRALTLSHGDNFKVEVAESAEIAMQRLREVHFDLLITDLRLPGMSGLDLLEEVHKSSPDLRSILITAYGSPKVEEQVRSLANAYLPKPFRLGDLLRLVRLTLNEPAPDGHHLQPETPLQEIDESPTGGRTHFTVLATDLDGTLTTDPNGQLDLETWETLRQLKTAGFTIILVTGRTLDSFSQGGPFSDLCEAIVAENGAIVYFPRRDTLLFPFGRLTPEVMQRLHMLDIPMERGMAIVATTVPHDRAILDLLREVGGGASVEYNRGAVMVLPLGATKGTGLRIALDELGFSPHNVIACGDAENDRSLFEVAEYAAAVQNAPPTIRALADTVLPDPDGQGIRGLLRQLLAGRVPGYRSRLYRQLALGHVLGGDPLHIDPFILLTGSMGIFGASSTGKSWLAGLLAEELLRQGYQVCLIDPEGDYRALSAGPRILQLGGAGRPLPPVTDVFSFLETSQVSLVLDFSVYDHEERALYLEEVLRAVQGLRARRGRPHWLLVDEAQAFCDGNSELSETLLAMTQQGGVGLVSYRPSQLAPAFHAALNQVLLTRLGLAEDIEALYPLVGSLSGGREALTALPFLPIGQAFLCYVQDTGLEPRPHGVIRFQAGPRSVPHIRHLHKYLRAPLPAPKRFYFHDSEGRFMGRAAANLWEFRDALTELPISSLEYHLQRGDFEHWAQGVLRDDELARRIHKLAIHDVRNADLRQALLEIVIVRYEELDSLG
jgi:hydroxymethylpyrimidine pyrophosphatase-like HAD family hydrolase/ActR/RegA family two-component response regulator